MKKYSDDEKFDLQTLTDLHVTSTPEYEEWLLVCRLSVCLRMYVHIAHGYVCNGVGKLSRRAMGWTTRVPFPTVQDFSLLHSVYTGSGAHPASYPMGTGGSFLVGHSCRGMKLTTHLRLVPRSRKLEVYLHSPTWLHCIVFS
jgi:hypothetical protein